MDINNKWIRSAKKQHREECGDVTTHALDLRSISIDTQPSTASLTTITVIPE